MPPEAAAAEGEEGEDTKPKMVDPEKAKALKTKKVQYELCDFLKSFDLAAGSTDVAQSALQSVFATDKQRFLHLTFDGMLHS